MLRFTLLLMLLSFMFLTGCPAGRPQPIPGPAPLPPLVEIGTPKTAAEQSVVDAEKAVAEARTKGDTITILTAEQRYARAAAKLALQQAKNWQQADEDKGKEIIAERNAARQTFLYWFSGIVGLLAILAGVGAFVWPTARVILRPIAVFLGVLVPVLLFAAWLIPYLHIIAMATGALLLAAGGWYLMDNERRHRLKDKTTEQVVTAIGRAKDEIPAFKEAYKPIFQGEIDTDADQRLNGVRSTLAARAHDSILLKLAH